MKEITLSNLFSVVLVFGGESIIAFVDDLGPADPMTPLITEPTGSNEPTSPTELVGPAEPPVIPTDPVEPSKPAEPIAPSESEKLIEPIMPIDLGMPVEPTEPNEPTEPSQPIKPTTPGKPEKPAIPEQSREPTQPVIPEKPVEPETPKTPGQPTKPIDVVTIPNGEIDKTNQLAETQSSIPIETSNLAEVIHVPSETTPITTEAGGEIIAVDKGVPLAKTPEGLKPVSNSYKVLPSGNVEVRASDGKMKVLPHTGEKFILLSSVLGSFFILVPGFFLFKENRKKT